MKVKITVTKTVVVDTNDIRDNYIKAAVERLSLKIKTKSNLDKSWVADWVNLYSGSTMNVVVVNK